MNVHKRKLVDGVLHPTQEDYDVALKMMKATLQVKFDVVSMNIFAKNISDLKELENVMNSNKLSEERKHILKNLIQVKKGKIIK